MGCLNHICMTFKFLIFIWVNHRSQAYHCVSVEVPVHTELRLSERICRYGCRRRRHRNHVTRSLVGVRRNRWRHPGTRLRRTNTWWRICVLHCGGRGPVSRCLSSESKWENFSTRSRSQGANQLLIEDCFAMIVMVQSSHRLTHVTTAKLSWHVYTCYMIGLSFFN